MAKPSKHHKQPQKPVAPQHQRPVDRAAQPAQPGTWVRRKITATLQSDAHLGSGVGGQGLHALLARDRESHPVIWSTHLEGLLREVARSLLGSTEEKRLFGEAGGKRQELVFTSLYLEQAQAEPQSRVWRSTARESVDNRAPKEDTLRAIEFVPNGTKFEGFVELRKNDLETLERLLQEIDSIGHGRASGAGLVQLVLSEAGLSSESLPSFTTKLCLQLTNLDPLCIAKTATPGNIIPTQQYIPGRTLLGALCAWLLAEGTAVARNAAELLVKGQVSVCDALPLQKTDSKRSLSAVEVLPAPLTLQSKKPEGQTGSVPWWARTKSAAIRMNRDKSDPDGEKLKRPEPDLFVQRIGHDDWETHRPDIRVRLRNGRPDPKQPDPSLFAVEQIVERTDFLTELCGAKEELKKVCEALEPVLSGRRWLRVGRSGTPVAISRTGVPPQPIQPRSNNAVADQSAYLTLTADLLFRDESLRWQTRLTASTAKDLPGLPEEFSKELTKTDFDPILQEETEIRGFNGTSGLWRLPSAGIRRGSVFKVSATIAQKLRELASKGQWLGERTHEGFGRFRIDDEDKLPGVTPVSQQNNRASSIRAGRSDDAREQVANTTKRWSDAYAKASETESSPKPSHSQWQDLVTELDLEKSAVSATSESEALKRRKNPQTAGAAGWKHQAAQTVLDDLQRQTDRAQRAVNARMFVRWLRTTSKPKDSGTKEPKQEVAR